jgi:hypothetical protein
MFSDLTIDKELSKNIIKNIIANLHTENDCMMKSVNSNDPYFYKDLNIVGKHKLGITNIQLQFDYENFDAVYFLSHEISPDKFERSNSFALDIFGPKENVIEENTLNFTTMIWEFAECDISYPKFTYVESIKMWVLIDDFWDAKNGIDCNGNILVLNFTKYT